MSVNKIVRGCVVVLLLFAGSASAGVNDKNFGSAVVADVTSIYDADTFRVNVDGWPAIIGERVPVRVNGIDAPEIRGKCEEEKRAARDAKQFTVSMLRGAKRIELSDIRRGKYFRILADVLVDGSSLAAALIDAGHARPYDGGTRSGWCR